jgi:hypothetical protein
MRYDLFARSAVSKTEVETLSKASYDVTEKLAREFEGDYQAILTKHGFVSRHSLYSRFSPLTHPFIEIRLMRI